MERLSFWDFQKWLRSYAPSSPAGYQGSRRKHPLARFVEQKMSRPVYCQKTQLAIEYGRRIRLPAWAKRFCAEMDSYSGNIMAADTCLRALARSR